MTLGERTDTVTEIARYMVTSKTDSVLVKGEEGDILGIVTVKDIIENVVGLGIDPHTISVEGIISKPIITINHNAKVRDAIALMRQHNIRRLLVTENDKPIGTISQKMIVGNIGMSSITLPELEIPDQISCPYCQSVCADKDVLSRHIDDIHIGKGLLEGNLTKATI